MLQRILDKLFARKKVANVDTAKYLRGLFGGVCAICRKPLDGHPYSLIGQHPFGENGNHLEEVKQLFAEGDWARLHEKEVWDPSVDFVQIYEIGCLESAAASVFLVNSYASSNLDDEVISSKQIAASELDGYRPSDKEHL